MADTRRGLLCSVAACYRKQAHFGQLAWNEGVGFKPAWADPPEQMGEVGRSQMTAQRQRHQKRRCRQRCPVLQKARLLPWASRLEGCRCHRHDESAAPGRLTRCLLYLLGYVQPKLTAENRSLAKQTKQTSISVMNRINQMSRRNRTTEYCGKSKGPRRKD